MALKVTVHIYKAPATWLSKLDLIEHQQHGHQGLSLQNICNMAFKDRANGTPVTWPSS